MVRILLAAAGLLVLGVALWYGVTRGPMLADNYPDTRNTGPLVVFASIPYWDQDRAFDVLREHAMDIDMVSLFWYELGNDGSIRPYSATNEDRAIIEFARDNNIRVIGLIANLPETGTWDSERVQRVIDTPEARAQHIESILNLVDEKGFDGINIDYEFLRDSQTEDYTAFINELGAALKERGKILVVAIHPQRSGSETRGQDIPSLTGATYLAYMTYDQHWETSDPGAMAEIGWIREVLEYADTQGVPMNRILLGVPLDGYDWPQSANGRRWGRADGVQYEDAIRRAQESGADIQYDDAVQAPYFTYDSDGIGHEVWFEDVRSFTPKRDIAKEFGLAGIALWRLGREDQRIYDVIDE